MPNGGETKRSAPTEEQESPHSRAGEVSKLHQQLADAREKIETAEKAAQEAGKRLRDDCARKTLIEAERKARRRLRDFVQQSLSDILAGVDDAAVYARHRQLDGGLKDSGFITPGRIGSLTASGRESTVEFDLAIVAGEQVTDHKRESQDRGVEAKVSFMDVIPLGFSAEARSGVRSEKHSEERSEVSRHNRVRFTVPVTFASLDDPAE